MLQRYLLVWLGLLSLAAFYWPRWQPGALDPFAATSRYLPYLFAATMFSIGCLLPPDELRQVARRWPTVFGGTAVQYTVMPLTAYAVAHLAGLEGDVLLGAILVGCVPGAMASNVLTLTARGNVSYSVSLTTVATVGSPFVVPAVLFLTLRESSVDRTVLAERAFWLLTLQVVGPVLAGHLLARRLARLRELMQRWGSTIANLAILWIIVVVVNANHERIPQLQWNLAGALVALNLTGYLAGSIAALVLKTTEPMRRALALEIGMQNAGLGSVLAVQLFAGREIVALPSALYTFGCMLTGTVLAQHWSRRPMPSVEDDSPPLPLTAE